MKKVNFFIRRIANIILDNLIFFLLLYGIYTLIFIENKSGHLQMFLFVVLLLIYLMRDTIYGQGPAKKIFQIVIIDSNSRMLASPIQCLIRSLFIIIWPIEFFFVLVNPSKRLGDRIAGTELIPVSELTIISQRIFPLKNFIFSLIITTGFLLILIYPYFAFSNLIVTNQSFSEINSNFIKQNKNVEHEIQSSLHRIIGSESKIKVEMKQKPQEDSYLQLVIYTPETKYINDTLFYLGIDSLIVNDIHAIIGNIPFKGNVIFASNKNDKILIRTLNINEK